MARGMMARVELDVVCLGVLWAALVVVVRRREGIWMRI
jgi:hypothetical protein